MTAARIRFLAWGALLVLAEAEATASAPPGRFAASTDTVLDNKTHLVWQRSAASARPFSTAAWYCQSLSLGGFATGWRLPTRKELESLVDETASRPAVDATAFPATPAEPFWTSTPYAPSQNRQWVVDFATGSSIDSPTTTGTQYRVRCVR